MVAENSIVWREPGSCASSSRRRAGSPGRASRRPRRARGRGRSRAARWPCWARSSSRPGVPTTTSTPLLAAPRPAARRPGRRRWSGRGRRGCVPAASRSRATWTASSRVGTTTSACGLPGAGSASYRLVGGRRPRCSSGTPKPRVLPVPVRAWPMRSWPASAIGRVSSWIANGWMMPTSARAATISGCTSKSRKSVFDHGEPSGQSGGHTLVRSHSSAGRTCCEGADRGWFAADRSSVVGGQSTGRRLGLQRHERRRADPPTRTRSTTRRTARPSIDLLGVLAYGELTAFDRLADDAGLAPTLDGKAALAGMAVAEFGHYERLEAPARASSGSTPRDGDGAVRRGRSTPSTTGPRRRPGSRAWSRPTSATASRATSTARSRVRRPGAPATLVVAVLDDPGHATFAVDAVRAAIAGRPVGRRPAGAVGAAAGRRGALAGAAGRGRARRADHRCSSAAARPRRTWPSWPGCSPG